jgi:nitrate reductase cytochrome c-type subunit
MLHAVSMAPWSCNFSVTVGSNTCLECKGISYSRKKHLFEIQGLHAVLKNGTMVMQRVQLPSEETPV